MGATDISSNLKLSPLSYLKVALRLLSENKLQGALQSIDAAIVFSHNSPFYIYQKIRILYDLGAYKSCSNLIVSQLEYLYKHSSLYILYRSIDYYQKINNLSNNDLEELLKSLKVPYSLAEDYSDLLITKNINFLRRAKIAHVKDKHTTCISYLDLYTKNHLVTSEVLHMKADSYHLLGDLSTALIYYKDYLDLEPDNPNTYMYIGQVLMELNQNFEAIQYFKKSCDLDPTNKDCLSCLAECNLVLGKYDVAVSIYQTIEKYYSKDIQNYFNLFYTLKKLNKTLSIRRYHKKIKELIKNN